MPPRPNRTCEICGDVHACKATTKKNGGDEGEPEPKPKPTTKPTTKKTTGSVLRDLLGF